MTDSVAVGLMLLFALFLLAAAFWIAFEAKQVCDDACHPAVGLRIERVCHCATETGWERLPSEVK